MKKLFSVFVSAALLALGTPAFAQSVAQDLANDWAEAYNTLDKGALEAVYSSDAVLYLHGAPMIEGRSDIGDFWAQDFLEGNPLTLLTVTHFVEGFDMILVHGNYQVVDRDTGAILGFGRFAHIWHDNNGEWELDRDLWNQPYEDTAQF